MLLGLAIAKAGSTDGAAIRAGLLAIPRFQGLIKTYEQPFTEANHDALDERDYVMVRYNGEQIEPIAS